MHEFRVSSLRMEPAHTGFKRFLERFAGLQPYVWKVTQTGGAPRRPGADTILGNSGVNSYAGAEYEPVRRQYVVHRSSLGTRNTRGYRLRNWGTRVSPEADIA